MSDHSIIAELLGQGANLSIPRVIVRMCGGNYTVAAVLCQLVFWSGKTGKQDGWFYKSQAELAEELELSRDQVKRAIAKAKGLFPDVIETKVRRANGAPTTHFKVCFSGLVKAANSVCAKSPNPMGESTQTTGRNRPIHCADAPKHRMGGSAQSITDPNTDPINRSETSNTRKNRLDFSIWPETPSKQVFDDWKALRDKKRAPITQTVINRLAKKLQVAQDKFQLSVDDVLGLCVERGWQGFEIEWLERHTSPHLGGKQTQLEQRNKSAAAQWVQQQQGGQVYDHEP